MFFKTDLGRSYPRFFAGVASAAVVALVGATGAGRANAQIQVTLTPSAIIGGSGSYAFNPYNVGQFAAGNVFDNQLAVTIPEPNQSPGDADGGYWLGKEGDFQEFFVFDLGSAVSMARIDLFNTHNATFNDRGTRDFQIFASNSLTALVSAETGAGGFDLLNPVLLTTGTLSIQTSADDPITTQGFTPGDVTPYRYVRFNALNSYPVGSSSFGVGLNEVKVFASREPGTTAAPEPATLALVGAGLLPVMGAVIRRRQRKA